MDTRDIYRQILKRDKSIVKEKLFSDIINTVHELIIDKIVLDGRQWIIPYNVGKLEVIKKRMGVKMVNGEMKIYRVQNWRETMKLMKTDPEFAKKRGMIYYMGDYWYKFKFSKNINNRRNMLKKLSYLCMAKECRDKLKDLIEKGEVKALEIERHDRIY